jgi:hypothetical protein
MRSHWLRITLFSGIVLLLSAASASAEDYGVTAKALSALEIKTVLVAAR